MTLIIVLIAGYVLIGILGSYVGIFQIGASYLIFFELAERLNIDPELIFLFGLVVGSTSFLFKMGHFRTWKSCTYQIITFFMLGYYGYVVGLLPALYLLILACIFGGVVIYPLLRTLQREYKAITLDSQVTQAHIFSTIGLANLVAHYLLYGIA